MKIIDVLKRAAGKLGRRTKYVDSDTFIARLLFPFGWEEVDKFSGIVYAAIDLRAKTVARAKFRIYKQINSDEFEEVDAEHEAYKFLNNLSSRLTRYQVIYKLMTHLDLTGNAYLYILTDSQDKPREAFILKPDRVEIVPKNEVEIDSYKYHTNNGTIVFSPDEIVHLFYPDPDSNFYGKGPLQAALISVNADLYMRKYWEAFFENSANPRIVYETEPGTSLKAIETFREELTALYAGIANAGRPFVLPPGVKIKTVSLNPVELDWLKSRQVTIEDIIVAFQTPKTKLGLETGINKAIAEASDYTFKADVIEPILTLWDEVLTKHLIQRYFSKELIVKHDSIVPRDRELQLREYQIGLTHGWLTPNRVAKMEGWKTYEGGDVFYFPVNLAPIGQEDREDDKKKTSRSAQEISLRSVDDLDIEWRKLSAYARRFETKFEITMRRFFRELVKEVISRLNDLKTRGLVEELNLIDIEKWVKRLTELLGKEYEEFLIDAFQKALQKVGGSESVFSYDNPLIAEVINQVNAHIRDIVETTINQLNKKLAKEIEAYDGSQETLNKIIDLINEYLESTAYQRAKIIATTIVTAGLNASTLYALEEVGVSTKVWISQRDNKVRETHKLLDGQKIPVSSSFRIMSRKGEVLLRFPGDPQAPAEETVNCRCYIIGQD